jgi:hypothetical protein
MLDRRRLDRRDQRKIILDGCERRQEYVHASVALLDTNRGAHDFARLRARRRDAGRRGLASALAERVPLVERILFDDDVDVLGRFERQCVQRQTKTERRIAGDGEYVAGAKRPQARLPLRRFGRVGSRDRFERQHETDRIADRFQLPDELRALLR